MEDLAKKEMEIGKLIVGTDLSKYYLSIIVNRELILHILELSKEVEYILYGIVYAGLKFNDKEYDNVVNHFDAIVNNIHKFKNFVMEEVRQKYEPGNNNGRNKIQ